MKTAQPSVTHAQFLVWEPLQVEGAEGAAWIKTLGKDVDTGARTALVRYDTGYRQPEQVSTVFTDNFVLEGEMAYGDRTCRKGTYYYRPPGTKFGPIETSGEVATLVMTGGRQELKCSPDPLFVEDVEDVQWQPDPQKQNRKIKILRTDKQTRVQILIAWGYQAGSVGEDNMTRIHDYYEELYVVGDGEMMSYEGEVEGHFRLVPGTYICRQPNASLHGDPQVTKAGYQSITRREGWVAAAASDYTGKDIVVSTELPVLDFLQ